MTTGVGSDTVPFELVDERGPQQRDISFEPAPEEVGRVELAGIGRVTMDVRASAGDLEEEYILDGKVEYTADLQCVRCLEPYPFAMVSSFAVRYRPRRPVGSIGEEEVEISEEELEVEYYSEPSVSLRELALEQVQLSLPMKPLCDEGCLGLCVHCGANLNRESCGCASEGVDVRWGGLREIREQLAKKKDI
ncbi:MAG TPA: DUF177 domain-containing protein [Thermoanaerobaculia bacterium]|nr:DUF177 domain-containing protein [Thermoanaerobaculia bacterium]